MANSIVFTVDGTPIENVTEYKYLGRILSADDRDDEAVSFNLQKANSTWHSMCEILRRDTANPKVMARFYVAVVQSQLLYGSETWVLSARLIQRLEHFHHRCAREIAHRPIERQFDGTWVRPDTDEVLDICGLSPITTYIAKRKTTLLVNYARPTSTTYTRCITSTQVGSSGHLKWW